MPLIWAGINIQRARYEKQGSKGPMAVMTGMTFQEFCVFLVFLKFIYFWLRWVFVAACGFSLVVARWGYFSLRCTGFSLQWLLLLQNVGSTHMGFSSCGTQPQ